MNNRSKRRALAASVATTLVLVTAACSNSGGGSESVEGSTIKVLVSSGHQQFNPVWDKLPEFTAQTGIKVELDQVATTDIEGTFLRDQTVGSCTYDNVSILDGALPGAAKYMEDLGPYLQKDGSSVEQLLGTQVDWTSGAMTYDGKLKYYPYYSGSKAVAYRVDLFEDPKNKADFKTEFGYDLPTPPKSPKELQDLAKFFTRDGMYGIVFSGAGDSAETTLGDLIFRSGVNGYQDEQGNALWGPEHPENQQAVTDAASWLSGLVEEKYAPAEVKAMATGDSTAFYTSGKAAMIYDHVYLPWAQLNAANVTSEIGESGSFEPPSFAPDASGLTFFWGRGIPTCSKNKDASWQFMKWVMSEENLKLALTKGTGVFIPTDTKLLDWATTENIIPSGVADAVSHSKPYQITTATGRIRQKVNLPLVENLLQGALTPEEYTARSGAAVQEEAEKSGLVK